MTAYRLGHIPRAIYLPLSAHEERPWWNRVDDGRLLERLLAYGVTYDTLVVLYSRDTIAAARAAMVLMYAGYCGTGWRASEACFYAYLMG